MIIICGLTSKGVSLAKNPRNPRGDEFRVIHFLYNNNNAVSKDTICQYCFGGDTASCNIVLGKLKQAHIIAYDVGGEI